ncbi:ATP-grasp fold amidoligase family protein [Exiguobacterium alkaliphilum]|uniref:ATP-grasp fold amidoligase family protein n=1 Tax=Exiguobacterium alkaliphilum TaxID=1428684 RepID=UPI00403B097C
MKKKIIEIIKNPTYLFLTLGHRGFFKWLSDEKYIKIAHRIKLGESLNLENPITYNEKLQWLKLYDRSPKYVDLVDKYEVREYIKNKIGEKYLIPLLGVWDSIEDIDFHQLPNQFVLKATHDSGGVVICDKANLSIKKVKKKLHKSLKHNFFWGQREWVYKDIKPRIVAEKYMIDRNTNELRDYKFFCFNGKVKALFIATDRGKDTKFDFFDIQFNKLPFSQYYSNSNKIIDKPETYEKMIEIAEILAADIPHVRVDLYEINGEIYFGEMTFFHFSGWKKFRPKEFDKKFGEWLVLPNKLGE